MSEQLLTLLKFGVLGLLYVFFFRVLRAVWTEINPPRALEGAGAGSVAVPVGGGPPAKAKRRDRKRPTQLVAVEPPDQRGRTWTIVDEMTLGRAEGCRVAIPEDTFASQIHARIFTRDGQTWVEDLGSTNGTYVNRAKVSAATAIRRGDLVQIGNTVMELG